ncbi:hypothetical protein ABKV19_023082 [Rosa sericea]
MSQNQERFFSPPKEIEATNALPGLSFGIEKSLLNLSPILRPSSLLVKFFDLKKERVRFIVVHW